MRRLWSRRSGSLPLGLYSPEKRCSRGDAVRMQSSLQPCGISTELEADRVAAHNLLFLSCMSHDFILLLGWACVAWTVIEFTGLGLRARRVARFRRPSAPRFHARDARGEAIDVDVVP